jgi:hypothetical protein
VFQVDCWQSGSDSPGIVRMNWEVRLYEAMQLSAVVVLRRGLPTPSNATLISVKALCRDCRVQPRGQRRKRGCGTYPQEIIHRSEEWNLAS